MRRLVMIAGAAGPLGEAMAERLAAKHEVVGLTHHDLDISDAGAVESAVRAVCPDAIVNCAAYTNVDRAERNPREALAANSWGPRALARAAASVDAVLIHFSTDFVLPPPT